MLTEEKKKREEAEKEKQELESRLAAYEEERMRQAATLEETLQKTQDLEKKALVCIQPGLHTLSVPVSCSSPVSHLLVLVRSTWIVLP